MYHLIWEFRKHKLFVFPLKIFTEVKASKHQSGSKEAIDKASQPCNQHLYFGWSTSVNI